MIVLEILDLILAHFSFIFQEMGLPFSVFDSVFDQLIFLPRRCVVFKEDFILFAEFEGVNNTLDGFLKKTSNRIVKLMGESKASE